MDREKKYLVTGGAGFLGTALIEVLTLGGFNKIRVISRNEGNLVKLRERFPHIEIIVGDISDEYDCERACNGVSGIFHLAAMKHIRLAEENVRECINSNVIGTINILNETLLNKPDFLITTSTDKVAKVNGVYGATKMLVERLFNEYERINKKTKYRVVRYGNVLYSTGSVLCLWKEKIKNGEPITITDPESTRFYWTVDEAVDLIFECLNKANNSNAYNTDMRSARLGDLVEAMMKKYGKVKVNITGLQPGENKHERIKEDGPDSSQVDMYSVKELLDIV